MRRRDLWRLSMVSSAGDLVCGHIPLVPQRRRAPKFAAPGAVTGGGGLCAGRLPPHGGGHGGAGHRQPAGKAYAPDVPAEHRLVYANTVDAQGRHEYAQRLGGACAVLRLAAGRVRLQYALGAEVAGGAGEGCAAQGL